MTDEPSLKRHTTLLFYGCILLLVYFIHLLFRPFLTSLAWAAILAAFFYSKHKRLEARFGRTSAAYLSTAGVALIIVVPFALLAVAFVQEAGQAIGSIDLSSGNSLGFDRVQRAWTWAQRQRFGRSLGNLDQFIKQGATQAAGLVANSAGAIFTNVVVVVIDLIIMLFAVFFFFRDGDMIMRRVRQLLPFDAAFREERIAETADLIRATISSGLVVALVQGALGGVTFAVLGIGSPIFWGVMMAFFSLLPLGAGIVWAPVAVWLLLTGETGRGVALILLGVGVIGLADNFLRPFLLSGQTEMNGLLVFISLLGGLAAFGLLGLVLGPIIMAATISFVDAYATERREGEPRPHS